MAVYFIQQGTDGPVKIGVADDPRKRLGQLQTANPRPLRLIHSETGDWKEERALHERFRTARLHGEWFRPVPALLQYIGTGKQERAESSFRCAICRKPFYPPDDLSTIRQSWLQQGGFGSIPDSAIVHPSCDDAEQKRQKRSH